MDLDKIELEIELKAYKKEVEQLRADVERYKKVIIDNDLADEIENEKLVSMEEQICLNGIAHLAKVFENGSFDRNDTTMFDTLFKVISQIRGHSTGDKKKKKVDVKEALKIVEGFDK